MDWSIYDPAITFDDPITQISGILLYKVLLTSVHTAPILILR